MSETNIVRSNLSMETTFDRILAFHKEEGIELSEKEEKIRERWDAAWTLLLNYHSQEQAANILKTKYGYSRATAHRDVQNSIKLFGNAGKSNKEGIRHILYEYSMKVFQLAASMKPPNLAEMNKAIKNMMDISGLLENDPDLPNFQDLEPHNYELNLPADLVKTLTILVQSGAINLSELREKAKTIDITHTDVENAESNPE
jgi:hypothetical protein